MSAFSSDGGQEGRPAAERLRAWVDEIIDATGTTGRALLGGCLLVGLGLGTLLWLTRQGAPPVESGLPLLEPSTVTTSATTTSLGPVVVHVTGAVVSPGVRELPPGSRVVDAVDAAGGLTSEADASLINMAAPATDGSQIYVPALGETAPPPATQPSSDGGAVDGTVNINTADSTLLESLPGVGPATAEAIIDHRERNGPFTSVDGLLDVRGIGEAKLGQLRDRVTV